MKKLPIGIQDFETLIGNDCVYIDKTTYIHKLLTAGGNTFFLSRPRRFGKSLLLSTIKAIMEGRRELFEGTYIYDKINWDPYPVISLDMGKLDSSSPETVKKSLLSELQLQAEEFHVHFPDKTLPTSALSRMVYTLRKQTGKQVVLLVDEYDKPILDAMDDLPRADQIRDILRNFYTVIKSISGDLQLAVLTGVSKISQVSIFSGLNNLNDISLDEKYAGICGYTQQELEQAFVHYIDELAQKYKSSHREVLERMRYWYDGYSWDGRTFLYNPFSVLLSFDKRMFHSWWFATGTPTFLLRLIRKRVDFSVVLDDQIIQYPGFTDKQVLEKLDLVPLLFQTGYLTIKGIDDRERYLLEIPNTEVKKGLTESLLAYMADIENSRVPLLADQLYDHFREGDVEAAIDDLRMLFSGITYDTHIPTEKYYHAIFQMIMRLVGIDHQAEVHTDKERADSILRFPDKTYVIELKYAQNENELEQALTTAMSQIKDKGYHEQYRLPGKQLHLLALAFTKGEIAFKSEHLD
ncbi:MAG: AAA family ATPase [Mangrovibacterium sp.]